jgi:hypothetical protein
MPPRTTGDRDPLDHADQVGQSQYERDPEHHVELVQVAEWSAGGVQEPAHGGGESAVHCGDVSRPDQR